jgi:hypothetical protein
MIFTAQKYRASQPWKLISQARQQGEGIQNIIGFRELPLSCPPSGCNYDRDPIGFDADARDQKRSRE